MITPGSILISTESLNNSEFEKTVILIAAAQQDGYVGVILNKLGARTLNQLVEFKHCVPVPIFTGGPVGTDSLFFIHNQGNSIHNTQLVRDTIGFGGDFQQAVILLNKNLLLPTQFRLFIGYCGWDYGQLEDEIQEGSWHVIEQFDLDKIFQSSTYLWEYANTHFQQN